MTHTHCMNKKISTSKWVGNTQHKPYAQHIAIQLAASFWRVKGLEPTSCLSTFKTAAQGMQPQNTQHRACTPETHKTSTNRKQLLMGMSTPCIYLPNTQHRGNRQKKKKKKSPIEISGEWTEGQVREVAKDQHHLKGLCSPNASSNFCVKTVNAHHVGENPMGWGRTDQQSMVWGLGDGAGWHRVRLATLSPFVCV